MANIPDHYCKLPNKEPFEKPEEDKISECRNQIEPWLSAVFQSEHLALLLGNGFTTAIAHLAGITPPNMNRIDFTTHNADIKRAADESAANIGRGSANFEDDIRIALELLKGMKIIVNGETDDFEAEINDKLSNLIRGIFKVEEDFDTAANKENALSYLKSFLISFASRTASRDRLQIFSTNYDRFIEYGCDMAGILLLDRFIGKIQPIFRTNKLELDYHYNPPGIRGEPRYVEGVARLTKLHGSVDWKFHDKRIIKTPIPFGIESEEIDFSDDIPCQYVIYPNSSKDIETAYFPYAELFRDFSAAICRPNSALITYGYGFGDSHINRIIEDMLSIPSTHIVIISWDGASGRIQKFYEKNNPAQFTLLIGNHFGDLKTLIDNYLPKAAIDRLSIIMQKLRINRGDLSVVEEDKPETEIPE